MVFVIVSKSEDLTGVLMSDRLPTDSYTTLPALLRWST